MYCLEVQIGKHAGSSCRHAVVCALLELQPFTSRWDVVVLSRDDLGFSDVGFHGGTQIPTPNLDTLAANGAVLSSYCAHTHMLGSGIAVSLPRLSCLGYVLWGRRPACVLSNESNDHDWSPRNSHRRV